MAHTWVCLGELAPGKGCLFLLVKEELVIGSRLTTRERENEDEGISRAGNIKLSALLYPSIIFGRFACGSELHIEQYAAQSYAHLYRLHSVMLTNKGCIELLSYDLFSIIPGFGHIPPFRDYWIAENYASKS